MDIRQSACFVLFTWILLSSVNALRFLEDGSPIVWTRDSAVRGKTVFVSNRTFVYEFLGIPYALPPTEKFRFRRPRRFVSRDNFINAVNHPPSCPQVQLYVNTFRNNVGYQTSEDCLYLNVWVPGYSYQRLPVIVFIHGGNFNYGGIGDPLYDLSLLSAYGDVITVSINYRLNALGFIYTKIPEASGNVGLVDQQLALRWVRENIKYFGGDPDQVTLMGHGSGATAAGYHLLSPATRRLFKRLILLSGHPYTISTLNAASTAYSRANIIAKKVSCSRSSWDLVKAPLKVLYCMLHKSAQQIVQAAQYDLTRNQLSLLPVFGIDDVLPYLPEDSVAYASNLSSYTILMGHAKDEYTSDLFHHGYFAAEDLYDIRVGDLKYLVGLYFGHFFKANARPILQKYFGEGTFVNDSLPELFRGASQAISDGVLICPANRFAEDVSRKGAKVYYYSFDHDSSFTDPLFGTSHGQDLLYMMGSMKNFRQFNPTSEEWNFAIETMRLLGRFAANGKPYIPSLRTYWPEYSSSTRKYVSLRPRSSMVLQGPRKDKCRFWSTFWEDYERRFYSPKKHVVIG